MGHNGEAALRKCVRANEVSEFIEFLAALVNVSIISVLAIRIRRYLYKTNVIWVNT